MSIAGTKVDGLDSKKEEGFVADASDNSCKGTQQAG